MGASRQNCNIFEDIRNKKWKLVWMRILSLLFIKYTWDRKYIIEDSFKRPFNKKIGCKLFGHRWSTQEDNEKYEFDGMTYCWKCSKWRTKDETREDKLNSLLK